jgi:hypothetical protein
MKAILTFQGFRQSIRYRTGTEDLYFAADGIKSLSCPGIHTRPPEDWTADVESILNQLRRQGCTHIALVSYSHGQAAARAAAAHAEKLGIIVDLWVACDAVVRNEILPRHNAFQIFAAARAMLKRGTITIPANIREVASVRQNLNRPNGHTLVPAKGATTIVHPPEVLPYPHNLIDDCAQWHTIAMHHLRKWAHKSTSVSLRRP